MNSKMDRWICEVLCLFKVSKTAPLNVETKPNINALNTFSHRSNLTMLLLNKESMIINSKAS